MRPTIDDIKRAEAQLKPCPFCGAKPTIILCDEEGNIHEFEYLEDPYSGIGFSISHPKSPNSDCPIASYWEETLFPNLYDDLEQMVRIWNHRH